MCKLMRKASDCQIQLKLWDKNTFRNVCIALAQKRKQLVQAEVESMSGRSYAHVKLLTEEISKLMDMEERMWN